MYTIFILLIIIFIILIVYTISKFGPKIREKTFNKQIKYLKNMVDCNKDDIADLMKTTAKLSENIEKEILDENETIMSYNAKSKANINKDAITITAEAIKDGLSSSKKYCKYCNTSLENDAIYCKKCGKKQ